MAEPVFAPEAARPPAPPVPAGSPGRYELTFVLAVPGCAVVHDAVDFAKLVHGGDSLLEVSPGTTELRITLQDETGCEQSAVAHVNASRRLRDIELAIRLVTSGALILCLAFIALGGVPVTDVKILSTGLAAGIIIDATIIRGVLAPALVTLLGRANWWLPRRAARLLRVIPLTTGKTRGSPPGRRRPARLRR